MKIVLFVLGFAALIVIEILRVYYIMPFPGSQQDETITLAYFIHNNIIYVRLIGIAMVAWPFVYYARNARWLGRTIVWVVFGFYAVVFYLFNFRYLADKMFLQLKHKTFLSAESNKKVLPKQLVVGVTIDGESKAYPIEIIGYHHQVRDSVGGKPVMVTYCTVCRTGRVFSPMIDGKNERFRLVGMDHFNAMFEDASTKSWWRQVNGEAIVGPSKGKVLTEIPSARMTLAEWTYMHPETKVLQPDTVFMQAYDGLKDYDEGKRKGKLEKKDSLSWQPKSWVVGVQVGMESRAYDWIELQKQRVINDVLGDTPIVILANPDSMNFYVYDRRVNDEPLEFSALGSGNGFSDSKTSSRWSWSGRCEEGTLKGALLKPLQSYQEYWHSWQTFHPKTSQYKLQ